MDLEDFSFRLKKAPNPRAVAEPRMVRGSGTTVQLVAAPLDTPSKEAPIPVVYPPGLSSPVKSRKLSTPDPTGTKFRPGANVYGIAPNCSG